MRKTKPDISLAIKTGHFNLLTTRKIFADTQSHNPAGIVLAINETHARP
jgi:hypothetical protein